MKARSIPAILALAALAGACSQSDQALPFESSDAAASRLVPADSAATVSSVAGASLAFPAGAFAGATTVTIQPVDVPAAATRYGTAASQGFQVEPAGTTLARPAAAELRFDPSVDQQHAWLATLVDVVDGTAYPVGHTRVDLSAKLVDAGIDQLGTLAVVVAPSWATFPVQGSGASLSRAPLPAADLLPLGSDSARVSCAGPDHPCTGLTIDASQNLLDEVEDAAAVYPTIEGALHFSGGHATGELSLDASIRVLLQSGATAENVDIHATLAPTAESAVTEDASAITITNVHFVVAGSDDDGSDVQDGYETLVISKSGGTGNVAISRDFQLSRTDGSTEAAWVRANVPVQIYQ
ncbi:MAG TPA: hypothetical protein VFL93_12610 [Longimicrobiaceae bacterium]|nr:hypothetical protein [Longimicrobiaceae bacterium]